jgi:YHS domain-containing protein
MTLDVVHRSRRRMLAAAVLPAVSLTALAQQDLRTVSRDANLPALQGYDPVTHFTADRPQRGRPDFTTIHAGATYQFVSKENAALFAADPLKFAPQFGGHCAYAASRGYKAPGSPTDYQIVDGKLYLSFNAAVHKQWQEDMRANIDKGHRNWKVLESK